MSWNSPASQLNPRPMSQPNCSRSYPKFSRISPPSSARKTHRSPAIRFPSSPEIPHNCGRSYRTSLATRSSSANARRESTSKSAATMTTGPSPSATTASASTRITPKNYSRLFSASTDIPNSPATASVSPSANESSNVTAEPSTSIPAPTRAAPSPSRFPPPDSIPPQWRNQSIDQLRRRYASVSG